MEFRARLAENEALVMGQPIYPDTRIVTQAKLGRISADARHEGRIIARARAHFAWAEGPSFIALDLDRPDEFTPEIRERVPTTPEEWRDLLIRLIPGLDEVQMAWVPSSSSYIYRDEQTVRFADALHDALVLEGLVWYAVRKSGNRLRFPFDFAMFRPDPRGDPRGY